VKNQQECADRPEVASEAATDAPAKELSEFTAAERERLRRFRRKVQTGQRSDSYPLDKRQDFVRWLIEQGKLSDN
jgi:hypothetical protein